MFRYTATRFVAALVVALAAATLSTPAWAQHHGGHHGGGGFGHHYDFGHGYFGHYGYGYGYGHHYSPFYLGLYYGPGYGYSGDYYVGSYGYAPSVSRSYDSASLYADPRARQTTAEAGSDWQRRAEASFRSHHYEDAIRYADRAVAEMPRNGKLFLFLSQAHLAVGDYRAAAGAARQGLSLLDPRNWGWMVENFRGFYHDADYVGQMRRLEGYLEDSPRSGDARFLAGYHWSFLGYPAEARRDLSIALEVDPRDEMATRLLERFGGSVSRSQPRPIPSELIEATPPDKPTGPAAGGDSLTGPATEYAPPQSFEKPQSGSRPAEPPGHKHDK